MFNKQNIKTKPFLRWAGGKSWLLKNIMDFVPTEFGNYYEPFLGGGAVFFFLKSHGLIKNKCFLSDSNAELINTYNVIKSNLKDLINILVTQKDSKEEFYRIRNQNYDNPIEKAAKFLFLNKTSFNGIYRVNSKGLYNVPYGFRSLENIYNFNEFQQISDLLQDVDISCGDFKIKCLQPSINDFVFLDPPYTIAHENNGFVQYNQSIFSWQNQIELSNIVCEYKLKNVNYLLTNACHKSIEELYSFSRKSTLSRMSTVGGKGSLRTRYNELLITNQNFNK